MTDPGRNTVRGHLFRSGVDERTYRLPTDVAAVTGFLMKVAEDAATCTEGEVWVI